MECSVKPGIDRQERTPRLPRRPPRLAGACAPATVIQRHRCAPQYHPEKEDDHDAQAGDKLMTLTDVSEMLGIPVHTLYRWRYRGDGPVGYRIGRHVGYRREAVEAWLEQRADRR
jgi:excisionase family DNA binding protein